MILAFWNHFLFRTTSGSPVLTYSQWIGLGRRVSSRGWTPYCAPQIYYLISPGVLPSSISLIRSTKTRFMPVLMFAKKKTGRKTNINQHRPQHLQHFGAVCRRDPNSQRLTESQYWCVCTDRCLYDGECETASGRIIAPSTCQPIQGAIKVKALI